MVLMASHIGARHAVRLITTLCCALLLGAPIAHAQVFGHGPEGSAMCRIDSDCGPPFPSATSALSASRQNVLTINV